MSDRHSPTELGYLAMWAWSVFFCGLAIGGWFFLDDGDPDSLVMTVFAWLFAGVGSLPVAPFGLLLLHHLCRGIAQQWVHVVVAVVVGGLCGLVYAALFDGAWGMVPLLAASVGLARWAVVPHVPAHRSRRAARRTPGTPVDDDFAGTPPRW